MYEGINKIEMKFVYVYFLFIMLLINVMVRNVILVSYVCVVVC